MVEMDRLLQANKSDNSSLLNYDNNRDAIHNIKLSVYCLLPSFHGGS